MTLSIIILSYNTKALTLQCLKSISNSVHSSPSKVQSENNSVLGTLHFALEVIVVDNASTDNSPQAILAAYPQVKLIQSTANRGFAAGNNLGLKVAQGDYLLLLNSDTEVQPDTLNTLVAFMATHPQAGAVTPRVLLPDGRMDLACHRGLPTPWNAFTYFSGFEKLFPRLKIFSGYHQLYQDFTKDHQIAATAATALLIRHVALDRIGLLDEQFFLYGEDLDWCKRLTDAGFEIWYCPEAKVLHYKSASGKNQTDAVVRRQSIDHFYHTMKQFYEKHYQKTYPRWLRQLVYWGIDLKKKLHK